MESIIRLLAYVVSVFISNHYADGYWVVGPVFGLAVVIYDSGFFKKLDPPRHAAFLILSTLIYALVYRVSRFEWTVQSELMNHFTDSFSAAIVLGSLLMSLTHAAVFQRSKAQAARAFIWLVGTYYGVVLLMLADEKLKLSLPVKWLTILIALWQGIYLYVFYPRLRADSSK